MAEEKPSTNDRPDDRPGDRRGTIPFVSDAADAPDQEPPADANLDKAVAAEEALRSRHPNAGTIPQRKEDGPHITGAVKPQND